MIRHLLGRYLEDQDATSAYLKSSHLGHSGAMSPAQIDAYVARTPPALVHLTDSSARIGSQHCCIQSIIADTATNLSFDAFCAPRGGNKRFTVRPYQGNRMLVVMDLSPGETHDREAIGFNAVRYEELVVAPAMAD